MPPLSAAGAAEILRSAQKDEQYIQELRSRVAEIIQKTAGVQKWIKWRHEINASCDFLYFLVTTLSGLQTLGEEYVHIVQVDGTGRNIPSLLKRLLSVLIEASGPLILKHLLSKAERALQDISIPEYAGGENVRTLLFKWIPQIRYALTLLHRFHLVAFYFYGKHYHLSKHFSGIHYVSLQNWLSHHHPPRSYRLLGWLTFLQLSLNLGLQLHSYILNKGIGLEAASMQDRLKGAPYERLTYPAERCCLCLEKRRHSTTTPCGHLFCWSCIMEWLQTKKECPLCRDKVEPSQLVYLQNYS